ncbi:hypothetical protein LCGC14_1132180 [marine sediment metagenome]|uniref:Uncharacterized protein n=1 Tax=marine sediment metagenome TaxID=412755 RepID=A0A0F9M0Q6_9ZZZZ
MFHQIESIRVQHLILHLYDLGLGGKDDAGTKLHEDWIKAAEDAEKQFARDCEELYHKFTTEKGNGLL